MNTEQREKLAVEIDRLSLDADRIARRLDRIAIELNPTRKSAYAESAAPYYSTMAGTWPGQGGGND